MSELFDVREQDGRLEVLIEIGPSGEIWEGAATVYVRHRAFEFANGELALLGGSPITIAEGLRSEGWISPDDELPACGHSSRRFHHQDRVVCLLRAGHDGPHREHGYIWNDDFE